MAAGTQHAFHRSFVIGKQQKALAVSIQPPHRVHILREIIIQVGQGALPRMLPGKLAQHAKGFVKQVVVHDGFVA